MARKYKSHISVFKTLILICIFQRLSTYLIIFEKETDLDSFLTVIFYEFRVLLCISLISYFCIILTERKCFRGRLNKRERLCGQIRWQLLFQKLWPCRAETINYQRDTQASRRLYVCLSVRKYVCLGLCICSYIST